MSTIGPDLPGPQLFDLIMLAAENAHHSCLELDPPIPSSPTVNQLPCETLSEIFSLSVSKPVLFPFTSSPPQAPWTLTQVCSNWRNVALNMPNLWNSIDIFLSHDIKDSCDSLVCTIHEFLRRAGDSLISLTLGVEGNPLPPALSIIMYHMKDYFTRLRHLRVHPAEIEILLEILRVSMIDLETLSLSFGCESSIDHSMLQALPIPDVAVFHRSPKLRSLVVSNNHRHFHLNPLGLRIPWSQLTHLSFARIVIDFAEGHMVLRQCVNLTSLGLRISSDSHCTFPFPDTPLPRLKRLKVFTHTIEMCGQFLQPFVLPSLKHLDIWSESRAIWPVEGPPVLNAASLRNLESLLVNHMEPAAVLVFLTNTPSLVTLYLHSVKTTECLDELTATIRDCKVTPKLEVLESDASVVDSLVNILEKRGISKDEDPSPSATIAYVAVHKCPADFSAIEECLSRFRDQGIEIEFL